MTGTFRQEPEAPERPGEGSARGATLDERPGARLVVLLRAESQEALEALEQALRGLPGGAQVGVVRASVGRVTEGDIKEAAATSAVILGFDVRVLRGAANLAAREGVKVYCEDSLLKITDQVSRLLEAQPRTAQPGDEPGEVEFGNHRRCGKGEVLQVIKTEGKRVIAVVRLLEGEVVDGCKVKVSSQGRALSEARVSSMRVGKTKKKLLSIDGTGRKDTDRSFGLCLDPCEGLHLGDLLFFFEKTALIALKRPKPDEAKRPGSEGCGWGEVLEVAKVEGKHVVADVRLSRGEVFTLSVVKVLRHDRELSKALVASMRADERERDWINADLHMFTDRWGDEVIVRLRLDFCEGLEPGDRLIFFDSWDTPSSWDGVPIK